MEDPATSDASRGVTLELVFQAQNGDETALENLIRRMNGRVYAMVLMRFSPTLRRNADPEDVVQEIWIRAMDSLHTFDTERGTPFGAWLSTLARRTLSRLNEVGQGEVSLPSGSVNRSSVQLEQILAEDSQVPPSQVISRKESMSRLVEALRNLPEEQQSIFISYWMEERRVVDIADELGRSKHAVSMQLLRCNRALSHFLGDAEVSHPDGWK